MSVRKKRFFYLITIFFTLLFIEFCSFVATFYFWERGVLYHPLYVEPAEYEEYLNTRDEVLGWPSPSLFCASSNCWFDTSGSRHIPAFPDPAKYPSCVSLYGDSFTYGMPATNEDAWGNILSQSLNCRVSNYGVGGYGTDQAYLRFRKNRNDNSKVVILGYASENILRNVNQYRQLLYHGGYKGEFALKPRFIINNKGKLELIPLPKLNYEEFLKMVNSPEKYFKYEYFLPDGDSGILKVKFPCTLTLVRAAIKNFHIRAKIKGIPWYKDFYEIGHPSNALLVTYNIIHEFYLEAQRLHKRPLVLIIPTGLDFAYYNKNKKWPYENLLELLEKNKIEFLDAGPKIIEHIKNIGELFCARNAHFNAEEQKVLAEIVYEHLTKNGFIER